LILFIKICLIPNSSSLEEFKRKSHIDSS